MRKLIRTDSAPWFLMIFAWLMVVAAFSFSGCSSKKVIKIYPENSCKTFSTSDGNKTICEE